MGLTHSDRDRVVFVLGTARSFVRESMEMDKGWSRVQVVTKVLPLCFVLILLVWSVYRLGS
jgi:hypothetical protein